MEKLEIKVSKKTRMVELPKQFISVEGENLQNKLVFSFIDEFVNGQARLEYKIKGEKKYIILNKENNTYSLPVKNILTVEGQIDMQLVITEGTSESDIPVFKSNMFYLFCNSSINAVDEAPEGYEIWIERANAKLNQIDEVIDEVVENSNYAKEQGDYAKEQGSKIDGVADYVVTTSNEAKEKAETALSVSKGANQALSYDDYQAMITNFNAFESEKFNLGQQVMIRTLNVPDLWVYNYAEENISYEYSNDETFVNTLKEQGYVQVGWYLLAQLETQKVDLTEYVKNTDYGSNTKAGLVKGGTNFGIFVNEANGQMSIVNADRTHIDKRIGYIPMTPQILDYAVGSVVASETQRGSIKAWTSENEDGEIGLNISTEV